MLMFIEKRLTKSDALQLCKSYELVFSFCTKRKKFIEFQIFLEDFSGKKIQPFMWGYDFKTQGFFYPISRKKAEKIAAIILFKEVCGYFHVDFSKLSFREIAIFFERSPLKKIKIIKF